MISAALLHPGNRLLNGGTADFAMFGGQPTTTVGIGRAAPADHGFLTAFRPAPDVGSGGAPLSGGADGASLALPLPYDPVGSSSESDGAFAAFHGANPASAPTVASPGIAPLVPAPSGAGSTFTSGPLDGPLAQAAATTASPTDGAVAGSAIAGAFGAPVLDGGAGAFAAVADGGLAAAGILAGSALGSAFAARDAATEVVGTTVDATAATLDGLTAEASYLVGNVANHAALAVGDAAQLADTTLQTATATVDDLAATATAATDGALDGADAATDEAVGLAATTAGSTAAAVGDVAAGTGETLAGVTATTADTAAGVQDSVAATVMPLVDHLAGEDSAATDVLAGSDPVGGIATLTAMVSSADVFELPAGVVPAPETVTSAIDAVAADGELAGSLLGDDHALDDLPHHDDGALGIAGL